MRIIYVMLIILLGAQNTQSCNCDCNHLMNTQEKQLNTMKTGLLGIFFYIH